MLNKNQSHKRNSWKYAVVLPALAFFIIFFQVKVIAQEIGGPAVAVATNTDAVYVTVTKNSTDADLKKNTEILKEQYGIKLKFSKVKRNAKGEITAIKVEFDDKKGNSGVSQLNGTEPIKPIHFYKNNDKLGFGKPNESRVYAVNGGQNVKKIVISTPDAPDTPDSPDAPDAVEDIEIVGDFDAPDALEPLQPIAAISGQGDSRVYIQKDGEKPVVIVNGKVMKGGENLSKKELKEIRKAIGQGQGYVYNYSNGGNSVVISDEDVIRIKSDALNNARISMRKMAPEIRAKVRREMEQARAEIRRSRPEMEKARLDMERSQPEIEKAREEMLQAREEMLKAKAEMEQAKAELEKAKADMNRK